MHSFILDAAQLGDMGNSNFDQRYPAMFQPGGEDLAEQASWPHLPAPTPASDPVPAAAPPTSQEAFPQGGEPEYFPATATQRVVRWTPMTWIICSLAVLLALAGSAFCLLAIKLTPSSPAQTASDWPQSMPWAQTISSGAPTLLTVGLGMLAALFLMAARHHARRAWWFHGAAAGVGVTIMVLGGVALFSDRFFTSLIYAPENYSGAQNLIQWYSFFAQTAQQLLVLGLLVLALVVILRPGAQGAKGRASAHATFWTGAVMTGAGVFAWFSFDFFPTAQGVSFRMEDQTILTQPWTYSLASGGTQLVLVGTAVLLWWVFIVAATRRVPLAAAGEAVA